MMHRTSRSLIMATSLVGLLSVSALRADETAQMMELYLRNELVDVVTNPDLIAAIKAQNAAHAALTPDEITALDNSWRAEAEAEAHPMIDGVVSSSVSAFLRDQVATSDGVVTEVIVMDNLGLNVAVSEPTSDYWQGDEDKFTQTFGMGADAVHISELEQDESTGKFQGQASVTIVDPETGKPIGAVTFGIVADALI